MRSLILIGALLGYSGDPVHLSSTQSTTESAPTADSSGFALVNVEGFRVSVCAESGQTLAGAGALNAYLKGHDGLIHRNPSLDLSISVTATSCAGSACRCQTFPDQRQWAQQSGTLFYVANGVTVSGGTTVVVRIDGIRRRQ